MRQDLLNVQQGFRAAVYFGSICAGTEYNCAATDRQRDRQINDRQKNIIEKHSNPQKIEFAPERLGSKRERQFKLS